MGVQINIRPTQELMKRRGIERGGRVQKYIDSSVVRYCDKYVPMRTGILKRAIGTVFGSGFVRYNTPYAKRQYYSNGGLGKQGMSNGGLRGRKWFERMKAAHKADILNGAAKVAKAIARRR